MIEHKVSSGYLTGQILVSMPHMADPRFTKSVILLCAHSAEGAMGIILNKNLDILSFDELLSQLNIEPMSDTSQIRIHSGGPVEKERGFVLHSPDLLHGSTIMIGDEIALTATIEMVQSLAEGKGPSESFLALGYSGWGPGQLEQEIQNNGWLVVNPDPDLVFGKRLDGKWQQAVSKLGFDPRLLSGEIGHA